VPLTILTSSSFLTGIDLQLCCFFSSGDSEADMILRRSEDGAVKCALRDFRLEEDTFGLNFIAVGRSCSFVAGFSFASLVSRVTFVYCCGEYTTFAHFLSPRCKRSLPYLGF
jgi:hypothetical protein